MSIFRMSFLDPTLLILTMLSGLGDADKVEGKSTTSDTFAQKQTIGCEVKGRITEYWSENI